jgi:hypothetical protein
MVGKTGLITPVDNDTFSSADEDRLTGNIALVQSPIRFLQAVSWIEVVVQNHPSDSNAGW